MPWGIGATFDLELPEWPIVGVHAPDLSEPVSDYRSALERALSAAPLLHNLRERSRVAIVVDDGSRWTPVREALAIIIPFLHRAGIRPEDISISVAVGRHRAMRDADMSKRLGDDVVSSYRCFSPPLDDAGSYADLGVTREQIPVRVFRPVASADLRVLVGSVLPHLQAGFGGGWKLIFPGTSHRSTLAALHRQGLGGNMGRLIGTQASDNPMRRAVRSAAQLLQGPTLSISHLLGPPGTVLQLGVGCPDDVQDALAAAARHRFVAPESPRVDVVVVNNYPWPGDPMQSFKALIHHSSACRRGGVLTGFFWTDPEEVDRSAPLAPLRVLAAAGRSAGWVLRRTISATASLLTARAAPSAFMACWARELVVDRTVLLYSPPLHNRVGAWLGPVRVFARQDELWTAAKCALGTAPGEPTVRIFPAGGLTWCSGASAHG